MSSVLGVGTDLVRISRIAQVLDRHGQRFVQRILGDDGFQNSGLAGVSAEANVVAKHFAAKEAVSKALGTGFREGIGWPDIEISRSVLGAPEVILHGNAKERMVALGGSKVWLSLSDEGDFVVAFAVLS